MVDEEAGGVIETWDGRVVRVRLADGPRLWGRGIEKNAPALHLHLGDLGAARVCLLLLDMLSSCSSRFNTLHYIYV